MRSASKLTRPLLVLALLGALVLVVSGCGTTSADPARGRTLFINKCGVCHAMAEAGTTAEVGPDLDAAFAAAREVGEDSDTIEGVVEAQVEFPRPNNGNPANSMPADIVTGQDLHDVAAYVGEWAGVPGAEPPKVEGGPGAQVFAFDFGGSIRAAALAMGGDWHDLGGGLTDAAQTSVNLQPLARVHDLAERGWAADWIGASIDGINLPDCNV